MNKKYFALTAIALILMSMSSCSGQNHETKPLNAQATVTQYARYGTHMTLSGELDLSEEDSDQRITGAQLLLWGAGKPIEYPLVFEVENGIIKFCLSEKINSGIFLDSLPEGKFTVLMRLTRANASALYTLKNGTEYESIAYYSMTYQGRNKKIDVSFEQSQTDSSSSPFMNVTVRDCALPEDVYDIVIDPGHGGQYKGAIGYLHSKAYYEKDLNLEMSKILKKKLEQRGFKVALTRTDDRDVMFYGDAGRATLGNELQAKYSFTLHNNSSSASQYQGTEIYIALHSDTDFAKTLADKVAETAGYKLSNRDGNKVVDGVYSRGMTKKDIDDYLLKAKERGFEPFDISAGVNYDFMCREAGGISTGAFHDGRDAINGENKFRNSNNTNEGLLLEFGYMNEKSNLKHLLDNKEKYVEGLADGIVEYLHKMHGKS